MSRKRKKTKKDEIDGEVGSGKRDEEPLS